MSVAAKFCSAIALFSNRGSDIRTLLGLPYIVVCQLIKNGVFDVTIYRRNLILFSEKLYKIGASFEKPYVSQFAQFVNAKWIEKK